MHVFIIAGKSCEHIPVAFVQDDLIKTPSVREEFVIREKEIYFIPQKRIESLLEEVGFIKIHKFFKAYLFGGYVAVKK